MAKDVFQGIVALDEDEIPDYGKWLSKVDKTETCWLWTAALNAQGYGMFRYQGENRLAHRVGYSMLVGPVPVGMELDHRCRVRSCVRPDHLEPVTHAENMHRSEQAMIALTQTHIFKTECPKGHPYDEENTIRFGPENRWRKCRECGRQDSLARYYARKEQNA